MNWFWDNVYLKKEERTSIFIFVCLLALLIGIKFYLVHFYVPSGFDLDEERLACLEYVDLEETSYKKNRFEKSWQKPNNTGFAPSSIGVDEHKSPPQRFNFDPNTLSKDSFLLLGVNSFAIKNILKYREKGGKFFKEDDLSKIYGLDGETLDRIKSLVNFEKDKQSPYRALESTASEGLKSDSVKSKSKLTMASTDFGEKRPSIIEINTADTSALKTLKGIGPVYANRIVKFRNSLGGFYSVNQIADVWGISDSLFQAIRPFLSIDTAALVKQNINNLEKEDLIKHPYIDWQKAKYILNYKKMHGPYQSMDDLGKLHGLNTEFIDTLRHYFKVI